jgi:hypothetical protein
MTVVPRRTMEKAAGLTSPEKKLELIPLPYYTFSLKYRFRVSGTLRMIRQWKTIMAEHIQGHSMIGSIGTTP